MKNETIENGIFGGMSAAKKIGQFIKKTVTVVVLLLAFVGGLTLADQPVRDHFIDHYQNQDPKVAEVTE